MLHAQLGVQVRQGLGHQGRLEVPDDRPAHGDTLALTTGRAAGLRLRKGSRASILAASATRF